MFGIVLFIAFYLLGVFVQASFHIPIPGNVLGMAFLAIALFTKVVKLEWVDRPAGFVLKHMLLFFVPVIVGTIAFTDQLAAHWAAIGVGLVVSTLIVMAVTGWVTMILRRKEGAAYARVERGE